MSYTALYRKDRPLTFSDVIGQGHVTETLINQIKSDRIGHAYLFTGSRGTGKTTCAKIFARAVNCLHPVNGSPCGECAVCKALSDPSNLDISEIDAASNNRVDEVREIRERVKYPPVNGKYKVYIIDEVHMLTDSAFNALLKTLEEPPSFVIFILATTEVHKLPATILSRCMRFDFRLVGRDLLAENLRRIYEKEGKAFDEDAVLYIAQAGEGSVRDSLSIADMCLSRSQGKLTLAEVQDVLGAADRGAIRALLKSVLSCNERDILLQIDRLTGLGKSVSLIGRDLLSCARDVLCLKAGADALVIDTAENLQKLQAMAAGANADALTATIRALSEVDAELRYSVSPKIVLEAACLRAAKLAFFDADALSARIAKLETRIEQLQSGREEVRPAQQASERENAAAKPSDAASIWGRMVTYFRKEGSMHLYSLLSATHDVKRGEGTLIVCPDSDEAFLQFSDPELLAQIKRALEEDGTHLDLKIERPGKGTDMDTELERIKKLMGGGKVKPNVIR